MSTTILDDSHVDDSFARSASVRAARPAAAPRRLTVAGALATAGAVVAISAIGAAAIWYIHATTPATPTAAADARPGLRLPNGTRIPLTVSDAPDPAATPRAAASAGVQVSGRITPPAVQPAAAGPAGLAATDSTIEAARATAAATPAAIATTAAAPAAAAAASTAAAQAAAGPRGAAATDPLRALIDEKTSHRSSAPSPSAGALSWSPNDRVRPPPAAMPTGAQPNPNATIRPAASGNAGSTGGAFDPPPGSAASGAGPRTATGVPQSATTARGAATSLSAPSPGGATASANAVAATGSPSQGGHAVTVAAATAPPAATRSTAAGASPSLVDTQNGECHDSNVIARFVCRERVRLRFCANRWNQHPECVGTQTAAAP